MTNRPGQSLVVSVRLTEQEASQLDTDRGEKTRSAFIRDLVVTRKQPEQKPATGEALS